MAMAQRGLRPFRQRVTHNGNLSSAASPEWRPYGHVGVMFCLVFFPLQADAGFEGMTSVTPKTLPEFAMPATTNTIACQHDSGQARVCPSRRLPFEDFGHLQPLSLETLLSTGVPGSPAADLGADDDLPAEPSILWPSTPEFTPPSTPRSLSCEHQVVFDECGTMAVNEPSLLDESALLHHAGTHSNTVHADNEVAKQHTLMEKLIKSAWDMATTAEGCRVIQDELEHACSEDRTTFVQQLRGHVLMASMDPHANFVLQKCIALVPPQSIEFVADELKGHVVTIALHRYGCRVLERIIEYFPDMMTTSIYDEALSSACWLCRHSFGNFVIQHILKYGTDLQRRHVVDVIQPDIHRLARHRCASHVVRNALMHCGAEDKDRLVGALRVDAVQFSDLTRHHCGSFVVRAMRREERNQ